MITERDKLRARADALTAAAKKLYAEAEAATRYPPKWEVGMKVRFTVSQEWGPQEGDELYVADLGKECSTRRGCEYQVFFTNRNKEERQGCWTTPSMVEWIDEA